MLAAFAPALPSEAGATSDTDSQRSQALRLATTLYYEGVPYREARAVTPAGAAQLVDLLGQPGERKHHAQALLILAMAAHPGAYEAVAAYAQALPQGELDSAHFRACQLIPTAMGHLARADDRALAWLAERARSDARDPGFGRGAMRGERLGRMLRAAAVLGLGMAGRPEGEAVLREVRDRRAAPEPPGGVATEALDLSREIRARGHRAVLSGALR